MAQCHQATSTWANVDQDLWHHMASPGQNELKQGNVLSSHQYHFVPNWVGQEGWNYCVYGCLHFAHSPMPVRVEINSVWRSSNVTYKELTETLPSGSLRRGGIQCIHEIGRVSYQDIWCMCPWRCQLPFGVSLKLLLHFVGWKHRLSLADSRRWLLHWAPPCCPVFKFH